MKIEKINDNQIRCTLTPTDLADRQLKLSELAYGTDKAKHLFHDMMKTASKEFGFEADNIPLMIEAIPSSSGSVILIITKVDDPEELDTRFSNFSPSSDTEHKIKETKKLEGSENILDLLEQVKDSMIAKIAEAESQEAPEDAKDKTTTEIRLFSLQNLDSLFHIASTILPDYSGPNTLYQDMKEETYLLALLQPEEDVKKFHRACNMLSEYGCIDKIDNASLAYLKEHCEVIIEKDALKQLNL